MADKVPFQTPKEEQAFMKALNPMELEKYMFIVKREKPDPNLRLLEELDLLMDIEDRIMNQLAGRYWIIRLYEETLHQYGITQPPSKATENAQAIAEYESMADEIHQAVRSMAAKNPHWKETLMSLTKDESIGAVRRNAAGLLLERMDMPGVLTDDVEEPARDKPCPCGSHRKYKKCCGEDSE